nr:DUF4097 family beta strand repeat-containing protein [uncultured Acetobacterium sp.]
MEYKVSEVDKLEINCHIFNICVLNSLSDKIEITWSNTIMRTLDIKQEGNQLNIADHAAIGIYGTLALIDLKKDSQLLIKVPSDYNGKLILQTKEDKIHLTDVSTLGNIGISSNSGEILLENVNANLIDIRGNHGNINCYAVNVFDLLDISSENGKIDCFINSSEENYTVFCKTKNRRCNYPETSGIGERKLRIISKMSTINIQFQDGIIARKSSHRYNRHDSFKDW